MGELAEILPVCFGTEGHHMGSLQRLNVLLFLWHDLSRLCDDVLFVLVEFLDDKWHELYYLLPEYRRRRLRHHIRVLTSYNERFIAHSKLFGWKTHIYAFPNVFKLDYFPQHHIFQALLRLCPNAHVLENIPRYSKATIPKQIKKIICCDYSHCMIDYEHSAISVEVKSFMHSVNPPPILSETVRVLKCNSIAALLRYPNAEQVYLDCHMGGLSPTENKFPSVRFACTIRAYRLYGLVFFPKLEYFIGGAWFIDYHNLKSQEKLKFVVVYTDDTSDPEEYDNKGYSVLKTPSNVQGYLFRMIYNRSNWSFEQIENFVSYMKSEGSDDPFVLRVLPSDEECYIVDK